MKAKTQNNKNLNIFEELGIDQEETIDYWNKFILEYLVSVAIKITPENGVTFIVNKINSNSNKIRSLAFCFVNIIDLSIQFVFTDLINLLNSLILNQYDYIDIFEKTEIFFHNSGISEKKLCAILEGVGNLQNQIMGECEFTERVKIMENFLLEKRTDNLEKGMIIYVLILKNLSDVSEFGGASDLGEELFDENYKENLKLKSNMKNTTTH